MANSFYIVAFGGYLTLHEVLPLYAWDLVLASLITATLVTNAMISPNQLIGIVGTQLAALILISVLSEGYQGFFSIPVLYFKFSYLVNLIFILSFMLICIIFLFEILQKRPSKIGRASLMSVPILFTSFNPVFAVIASRVAYNTAEHTTIISKGMSAAGAFSVIFGILIILPSTVGVAVQHFKASLFKKALTICGLIAATISLYYAILKSIVYFQVVGTLTFTFLDYYIAIDLSKLL